MNFGPYGPEHPDATYVPHAYPESLFDTGEVTLNYGTAGPGDKPALVLLPPQVNSWWSYEPAMRHPEDDFEVFAVDLRGQGRSSRTPGRYTIDNWGNDLVRFISGRIGRPVILAGNSSGGLIAAWLSAYAPPGMIRPTDRCSRSSTSTWVTSGRSATGRDCSGHSGGICPLGAPGPGGRGRPEPRGGYRGRGGPVFWHGRTAAGIQGIRPGAGQGLLDRLGHRLLRPGPDARGGEDPSCSPITSGTSTRSRAASREPAPTSSYGTRAT